MALEPQATRPVVLVVDDEPMMHVIISRTLERAGWRVLNACDGLQAIELLDLLGDAPSLVITDLRMPRMDGAELGHWCAARYPTVPILYMSGFLDDVPPPANGAFLGKPFTPAALLTTVQELCSTGPTLTQHPATPSVSVGTDAPLYPA